MNKTGMECPRRTRAGNYATRWIAIGALAMAGGAVWLCADIGAQQSPVHAVRKSAPRLVRHVQTVPPTALNTLLRLATQAVNARDRDALKPFVTSEALPSFGWMHEKTTKVWTGDVLVLPVAPSRLARETSSETAPTSSLLYLAVFHAWHTCESDGDHIHRIEPTSDGGWHLGAEILETETGGYRVRDHDLTVSIAPAQHTAALKDTIRVEATATPLLSVCLLRLSEDFKVSALTSKNISIPYAQTGGVIAIVPPEVDTNHSFPLSLTYSGRVLHQGSDYITTQEATLNSYWYPHIARLPATSTITATAPPNWTPVVQGEKKQERRSGEGSLTVTYRNDVPNCYFTVDMGPYTITTRKAGGRTLSAYLLTPNARLAHRSLDLLEKSLAFYDTQFAPFPYTHYEVVETRGPFGGALEAYSFATFGAGTLPSVLPHELSHTWWGGLIPCTYTRSMWNESFAQYSSDLFARMNRQMADQVDADEPPAAGKRRAFGAAYDSVTMENAHDTSDNYQNAVGYGKGALALRVLEEQIGLDRMRASMKAFLAAHVRGEAAEWPEFARAVNKATGEDYSWFFDQWTKRTGLPRVRFASVTANRTQDGYVVRGDIVQEGEPYRLRLPLMVLTADHKPLHQNLDITEAQTHFELHAPGQPTRLVLDPDNLLPLATTAEQASVGFSNAMTPTNEAELQQMLTEAYGLSQAKITLIRVGGDGNQTFKVIAHDTPFIARIYGEPVRQQPNWAQYELDLLAHLAANGISVSAPVAGHDGAWMQLLPLDGAPPAPTALFTFAEGSVEWPTAPLRAHQLGAAFAQMHRIAEGVRSSATPHVFDAERLLHAPLRRMRAYLDASDAEDAAAWKTLIRTAARAEAFLAAIPNVGGAIGPIHGDLHQGNCHFNAEGSGDQLTFFDFSNAGIGWRVYDLSGFLWPLRDDTIQQTAIAAACNAFLEGYRSVRPLLPEEEKAILASVKARDFWEAGCWLEFGQNLDAAVVRSGLHSYADQFRRFPLPE